MNVKHMVSKVREIARLNGHSLTRFTYEQSEQWGPTAIAYCMVCDVRVSIDNMGMHAKSRFDVCGDPPEFVFNTVADVYAYVDEQKGQLNAG